MALKQHRQIIINPLRYHLFCAKRGDIESHQLPPCRDCFVNHAKRANYQAELWRRCLEQDPQIPSPVDRGWKAEREGGSEKLLVHWMDGQPAPETILGLLACSCPRKCELPRCTCLASGLKCTDMCKLTDCENQASSSTDDIEDEELDRMNWIVIMNINFCQYITYQLHFQLVV